MDMPMSGGPGASDPERAVLADPHLDEAAEPGADEPAAADADTAADAEHDVPPYAGVPAVPAAERAMPADPGTRRYEPL